MIESFFHQLKNRHLYFNDIKTLSVLSSHIYFYVKEQNEDIPFLSIGGATPIQAYLSPEVVILNKEKNQEMVKSAIQKRIEFHRSLPSREVNSLTMLSPFILERFWDGGPRCIYSVLLYKIDLGHTLFIVESMNKTIQRNILAFIGGFVATLIFHQGLLALLHFVGVVPMQAFNLTPIAPLGVPSVISLSFFGGLWGPLVWALVFKDDKAKQILKSIVFGAIGPTAVAFLVVFPLKVIDVPLTFIPIGLLLNGAWGLGLWSFMQLTNRN